MRSLLLIALLLVPAAARADTSAPLLYSRTNIIIMHAQAQPAEPPLPWQTNTDAPTQAGLVFDVEVRDANTLYNQEGWFNLNSPSDHSGVMLLFGEPSVAPVIPVAQYVPLDVLLVDEHGTIAQIMPNLLLSELDEEIYPDRPVLAFLLLKGGISEQLAIQPGDHVEYKLFRKPPTVLTAPGSPATAAEPPSGLPHEPEILGEAAERKAPAKTVKVLTPAPQKPGQDKPKAKP